MGLIKVGICPTMNIFAEELVKKNPNIEIINLGSAAQVLHSLSNNQIDIGLIGRKAKKEEFEGYSKELNNQKGFTLITNQKGFILENELENLKIYTRLKLEIVKKHFPKLRNVSFVDSFDNVSDVNLISWEDWNDDFELLIPVDEFHNKIIDFRKPYLFSKDEELINSILGEK